MGIWRHGDSDKSVDWQHPTSVDFRLQADAENFQKYENNSQRRLFNVCVCVCARVRVCMCVCVYVCVCVSEGHAVHFG